MLHHLESGKTVGHVGDHYRLVPKVPALAGLTFEEPMVAHEELLAQGKVALATITGNFEVTIHLKGMPTDSAVRAVHALVSSKTVPVRFRSYNPHVFINLLHDLGPLNELQTMDVVRARLAPHLPASKAK